MLRNALIFAAACVIVLVAFVWSENAVAPHFQACVSQYADAASNQQGDKKGEIVGRVVASESICTLQLIDRHNGFFSALAALAVAAFTYTLWRSTQGLLRATNRTVDLTSRNFAAEHRPWVSIDADLQQLRLEGGSLTARVRYVLKNSGNTPAGGIFVTGKALLLKSGISIEAERNAFRREGARKAAQVRQIGGGVIFPGEENRTAQYEFTIDREDVEKAAVETGDARTVNVLIFLCADYRFTFEDAGSHQTVAGFFIGPFGVPKTDAIYPINQFQLVRFGFGDYAD